MIMPVSEHPTPSLPVIDDPSRTLPHSPKLATKAPEKSDKLGILAPRSPSPSLRHSPVPPSSKPEAEPKVQPTPSSPKPQSAEIKPPSSPPPPKADEAAKDDPIIVMEIFQQILDLDDDTYEFSRGMTLEYFGQVESTFKQMDEALTKNDLAELSTLGHFLKGSSAALGVAKVQASCEKIQHYGQLRDEKHNQDLTKDEALKLITQLLSQVKKEYIEAERWLMAWYAAHPDPE